MRKIKITENIVLIYFTRPGSADTFDFCVQFNNAKTGRVFLQSNGSLSDLLELEPKEYWAIGVKNGVPQLDAAGDLTGDEIRLAVSRFCETLVQSEKQYGAISPCLTIGQRYLDYLKE